MREEEGKKKRYVRPDDQPKKPQGPPPAGCAHCRGGPQSGGAVTVAVVEYGPPPLRARTVTEYACRCSCARGAALYSSLQLVDDFVRRMVARKPAAEVLFDPTPRELAGRAPMTLEETEAESGRLSAILAHNPGWKLGDRVATG